MNIFLDDIRWPINVHWVQFDYTPLTWTVIRNYEDFVHLIQTEKVKRVSFDHDLDMSATIECLRSSEFGEKYDYRKVKKKTGFHCAVFLKEFCSKNDLEIPQYIVHSLNSQGRDNIINKLGKEKLIGTHSVDLVYDKADEILKRREGWVNKK